MREFRILSIDGGGIKGVFPAAFLAAVERTTGKCVWEHFDLIAGTSTGGIIALGLALGLPAEEIFRFYHTHAESIFPAKRSWFAELTSFFRVAYAPQPLKAALRDVFGDKRLGDCKTRVIVPATNAANGQVYIFKTAHHERFAQDHRELAVDVALSTSAAPSYFPNHRMANGVRLLDGGMWANNPSMIAAVEAIAILGQERDEVRMLSIGCTEEVAHVPEKLGDAGRLAWAHPAIELLMRGQSVAALNEARLMIGKDRVLRVQPVAPPGLFGLDKTTSLADLAGLGEAEARSALPQLSASFFHSPVQPFMPYY